MADKTQDPHKLRLKRVRLSFPDLFTPKKVSDKGEPKYGAAFLLSKEDDAAQIKLAQNLINASPATSGRTRFPSP